MTTTEQLREQTRTNHDSVDSLVMSVQPFEKRENYTKFLQAQAVFHKILAPIYENERLNQAIPALVDLGRYESVLDDLNALESLEVVLEDALPEPTFPRALGWLYCAEGSNLGAAILFKEAKKISIDEHSGASHLVGHADGRAPHWRQFCGQLNALPLTEEETAEAVEGAKDAFAYYKQVIRTIFSADEAVTIA